jgi:hypothetical protein
MPLNSKMKRSQGLIKVAPYKGSISPKICAGENVFFSFIIVLQYEERLYEERRKVKFNFFRHFYDSQ